MEVRVGYGGAEGIAKLKEFKPDIAFMDLGMPGMDGYQAARAMRATPEGKELFLVALSGWGGGEHRRRGLEAGFDRHIVKPIEADDLAEVLAAIGKPKP